MWRNRTTGEWGKEVHRSARGVYVATGEGKPVFWYFTECDWEESLFV